MLRIKALSPQLPASALDIGAHGTPDRRGNTERLKLFAESFPLTRRTAFDILSNDLVEHYQVDVRRHTLSKFGQTPRVGKAHINALHHGVLENDPPSRLFKIVPRRIHRLGNRILIRNRHKFAPIFVKSSMKGKR